MGDFILTDNQRKKLYCSSENPILQSRIIAIAVFCEIK